MKTTSVSGRERPFPCPGLRAGEPLAVRLALTIVFDPQGGSPTRVTSPEVARVDLDADRRGAADVDT
jgi:hypothetical protein